MRRADRLFEIIQLLRAAGAPLTAAGIAAVLEVSPRTIYRDIAALQAMRTPIAGEGGVGYVMRAGYDLPPLNFDIEEIEAIVVGLGLLVRTGDLGLQKAAQRVAAKIEAVRGGAEGLRVSKRGAQVLKAVDLAALRAAIRDERKLELVYRGETGAETRRVVQPIALIYYFEVVVLAAWCELRSDFRHFRVDRITACARLAGTFAGHGKTLRTRWEESRQNGPGWSAARPGVD